jgi:hypothetical protein
MDTMARKYNTLGGIIEIDVDLFIVLVVTSFLNFIVLNEITTMKSAQLKHLESSRCKLMSELSKLDNNSN